MFVLWVVSLYKYKIRENIAWENEKFHVFMKKVVFSVQCFGLFPIYGV